MAYIGRSVDIGMFEKQVLTPDSSTTTFTLTFAVGSANSLLVVYGGVIQEPAVAYSVSGGGQSIVFSEAPVTGHSLYIIYLGKQLTTPRAAGQETTKQTFTGDGTTTLFTLTDPPVVPAGIMVFVDGILQREGSGNNFVSSGSTINFNGAPDSGAEIDVYTLVKEKVSIDTVADGSITRAKLAASHPYWDASGNVGIGVASPVALLDMQKDQDTSTHIFFKNASTGTSARTRMVFYGDASAGSLSAGMHNTNHSVYPNQAWIWSSGSTTPLVLGTQGTPRLTITSAGNVGVGATNPTSKLTISTTGADGIELTIDAGSGGGLSNRLFFTHGGGAGTGVALVGANSRTEGVLRFNTGSTPGSTSGTQRLEFSRTGIGLGVVSPVDGIGIAFPGSQSASSDPNTLDDYEEGTWTPSMVQSGATFNHTYQVGRYTKVGNVVTITATLGWNSKTGGSGTAQLSGLPFPAINASSIYPQITCGDYSGFTFPSSSYTNMTCEIVTNTTNANFYAAGSGVSAQAVSTVGSNGIVFLQCTYQTN